jgi:hypothetical protein
MRRLGALSLWLAACSAPSASAPGGTAPGPAASTPATGSGIATAPHTKPAVAAVASPAVDPVLLVTDPAALAALERHGVALGDWFVGPGAGRVVNAELGTSAGYASLTAVLARDIAEVEARDPQAGVQVSRFPHRLFDVRWLGAKTAYFELIAVANRFDRAPFAAGTCGEIRLVYRLAYATSVRGTEVTSRLPLTLGIELDVPRGEHGCGDAARRWVPPRTEQGEALAHWLVGAGGPLAPSALGSPKTTRHRIVVNAQQVRWPSAVRPDLGGHAEYLLRSFRATVDGRYAPEPLENTPDVARLTREPKLKAELLAWLSEEENLKAVDVGAPFLPERFLVARAESVTPRGLARLANRPFRQLFAPSDFSKLDLSRLATVRSPEGLLRRLDELTCPGCHEARSIAGFHLLGEDPPETPAGNAVRGGTSPHLLADLQRRTRVLDAALRNQTPDFSQPFPERSAFDGYGAHCGLGTDATFAAWRCAPGLTCQPYDAPATDGVGQCLPERPRAAGDPCELGPVVANANSHRDRVGARSRPECAGGAACNTNSVGFPGGMCTESCGGLSPSSTCASIAVLEPFNACIARGEPFQACLTEHVRPAGLRACSSDNPCRDDYICARTPTGGSCIPPYFLFQLRVDGHP